MRILTLPNNYSYLRYSLMVLVVMALHNITYGQSKSGVIIGGLKPLDGAVVKNLNLKMYAVSNAEGAFTLKLNNGDTLAISSVGFKTDTLIYHEQSSLLITLKPLSNILKEVVIKDFKIDPLEKFNKNKEDYKQIYRIGDDKGWLMLGIGFAINIDKLYSLLGREGKNARKLQKTLLNDYYADIVDSRFSKSLVTKYTGYHGQQLDNFMIDNRPTYDFIKHASDYDIIKYIQSFNKNVASADSTIVTKKSK